MTTENQEFGYAPPAVAASPYDVPVGNDAMVAAPVNFTQATHMGELQQQQQEGRTTITPHDVDVALAHVENVVKELQARGATRDEVLAAVGHYANGDPALAAVVQDVAGKQFDANSNPLAPAKGGEQATSLFGKLVLNDDERPLDENGRVLSTTATLAAMGSDIPKTQGLPGQQRQQGQGRFA